MVVYVVVVYVVVAVFVVAVFVVVLCMEEWHLTKYLV